MKPTLNRIVQASCTRVQAPHPRSPVPLRRPRSSKPGPIPKRVEDLEPREVGSIF